MLPVHGTFEVGDDESVCRFMPIARFVDLLSQDAAFFPTIAHLGETDPLEGKQSAANYIFASGIAAALSHLVNEAMPRALGTTETRERLNLVPKQPSPKTIAHTVFGDFLLADGLELSQVIAWQAAWLNVQCWHQSKSESVAMWRLYGGDGPSICITSTAGRLKRAFQPKPGWQIALGAIRYIDHNEEYVPDTENSLYPFLCKERAYLYENELRMFAFDPGAPIRDPNPNPNGILVPVELAALIDRVIVSPGTDDEGLARVTAMVGDKLGKGAERSGIGRPPFLA